VLVTTPGYPRDCAGALGNCGVAFLDHGSIIPYDGSGCTPIARNKCVTILVG
jgi:hypothetical protein